jgi:hypothetical protein
LNNVHEYNFIFHHLLKDKREEYFFAKFISIKALFNT